jgi:hypothetical protein
MEVGSILKITKKKKKKDASYGDFGKNLKNNTVDL